MTEKIVEDPFIGILQNPKYEKLNNVVEILNERCIKISKEEKKVVNKHFKEVMEVFKATMKKVDSTFNEIFREITYTGSFFEGLKISNADEYDVNVIIKPILKMTPLRKQKYAPPGFIAIQVEKDDNCALKPYKDWLHYDEQSKRYFLKIDEVISWLQSVVDKAKSEIIKENLINDFEIKMSKSGPAWTLIFKVKDQNKKVRVDLVPCLEFDNQSWPGIPRKSEKVLNAKDNDPWYAVPKRPRNPPDDASQNQFWFLAWRLSFPIQEKHVMHNLNFLKYTIRHLKLVRDKFKIHEVASYYIKTLFLWEIERRKDKTIWSRTSRGPLFMYMLVHFHEALESGRIDYYWDKECNLIGHVSKEYLVNNANQVKNFIKKIKHHIDNNCDEKDLRDFIRDWKRRRIQGY